MESAQVHVSNEMHKKGLLTSPGGVRCIWLRHNMETFKKCLKALSAKVEQEGLILDENQMAALKKAKEEKQTHGKIEIYYPGFLVAQDTYYVGYIYQRCGTHLSSRQSSTPIPKSGLQSCMTGRMRLSPLKCSTTESFLFSSSMT